MKPSHAASVWVADGQLWVEFPSSKTDKVHTVTLPITSEGMSAAVAIFRARNAKSTVATPGAPTKLQVQKQLEEAANKFLKAGGAVRKGSMDKFSPELRLSARGILRQMGMI